MQQSTGYRRTGPWGYQGKGKILPRRNYQSSYSRLSSLLASFETSYQGQLFPSDTALPLQNIFPENNPLYTQQLTAKRKKNVHIIDLAKAKLRVPGYQGIYLGNKVRGYGIQSCVSFTSHKAPSEVNSSQLNFTT